MEPKQTLLRIERLVTSFPSDAGPVAVIDGLDVELDQGEILGLVGESGCGKSMTALSMLGLVPPPGRVESGRIVFQGRDLLAASNEELRRLRGRGMGMIFQEPMTSLNPVFTVGRQVAEAVRAHTKTSAAEAMEQAVEALGRVGIPDPKRRARAYPHELSGGLRQRAMIAMALVLNPQLLIADEPTTALDVTIQAQILRLMSRLREETGAAILLISHNLAVVAQMADRVGVMYTGRLMESAPVDEMFANPLHPYTRGLLACLPARAGKRRSKLPTIPGVVPPMDQLPPGCAFSDRCPRVFERCRQAEPALAAVGDSHKVRCFLHHDQVREIQRAAA